MKPYKNPTPRACALPRQRPPRAALRLMYLQNALTDSLRPILLQARCLCY
jgi:hypothetical protein